MIIAYLPPELVHIWDIHYGMFATRACHAPASIDAQAVKKIERANKKGSKTEVLSFSRRHANCVHSRPGKHVKRDDQPRKNSWFCNTFIHAHRVFYQYDGLLFARTTFIFSSIEDVEEFKFRLLPFQRNFLKSIIVNGESIPPSPSTFSLRTHSLPALENLLVFYETLWKEEPRNRPFSYHPDGALASNLSIPLIKAFHGGKIKELKVCVTAKRELKVEKDKSFVLPRTYKEVAKRLKNYLGDANGVSRVRDFSDPSDRVSGG